MNPQIIFVTAVLAILTALPCTVSAQSREEGELAWKEAEQLHRQAKSKKDFETALHVYNQALSVFNEVGYHEAAGKTLNSLGRVYWALDQNDRALEHYEKALEIRRTAGDVKGVGQTLTNIGLVYKSFGQYPKSVEFFQKALDIRKQSGDERGQGQSLHNIGWTYSEWGKYEKALEYYERALNVRKKIGDLKEEGQTLNNIGWVYSGLGQHAKALEYYEKALHDRRQASDVTGEAQTLRNMGWAYKKLGQHARAIEYYEKDLENRKGANDLKGEGQALNNIAIVFMDWGNYPKALEYCEKALEIRRKVGAPKEEAQTLHNIGWVYSKSGQQTRALEFYEKALDIRKKVGDSDAEAHTLNSLGLVYEDLGEHARAIDCHERALEIMKKVGNSRGQCETLKNIGNVYNDWGHYSKASECYERSLEIATSVGDSSEQGDALGNLGNVSYYLSQYSKAIERYEKALEMARKVGNISSEGTILNSLGSSYSNLGQYSKAVEHLEKSLEITRRVGDASGEGNALINLGVVHAHWGKYAKAREYYDESLRVAVQAGWKKGEGNALHNIGTVYSVQGQYAQAVEYYGKALSIFQAVNAERAQGQALSNLGGVNQYWGQYAQAIEYCEKALQIRKKVGDLRGEAQTLNHLATVYSAWGQYAQALEDYEKCLDIYKTIGELRGEARTLNSIGSLYASQGHYSEALESLRKGLEIFNKIGVPTNEANDNIGNLYLDINEIDKAELYIEEGADEGSLGRLCLVKADYPSAKTHYERLMLLAEKNRHADNLFTAYTGLGMALEGMGDNHRAAENFRKASDFTEDIRAGVNPSERVQFYNVKIKGFDRTAPYEGLARVLIKLNEPVEALRESEYTKARVFAEGLSKRAEGSAVQIPVDVLVNDSQLNEQLAALAKNLQNAYEKDSRESIAVLEPQVREAKSKLASHVNMLRRKYPLLAGTKYPQPIGLEQSGLKDGEWGLAYHVTDSGIIVYLTRGKKLVKALFKPIAEKEIDELVRKFRQPLEMGPRDTPLEKLSTFDFTVGKKLSDVLLSDILLDLPQHAPVIIIPDSSLGMLPFEMLVLNDGGAVKTDKDIPYVTEAEFFGDRNPISYYQSITALTLARIHSKQKRTDKSMLVMADPVFQEQDERLVGVPKKQAPTGVLASLLRRLNLMASDTDGPVGSVFFQRLALTSRLAKDLTEMLPNSKVCMGLDANKSHFLNDIGPSLNRFDKIVFATHGYFGKDLPILMEPVLVLSLVPLGTDGYLRMSEVMGLNINADIVALTACQTGIGKRISGEGTMGMGRAFQYAGAKGVLMSLWSVSELTSTNLVKDFFRHLKDGKSKLEALAMARKEVRSKGYDHPFFWAPFILVGEVN